MVAIRRSFDPLDLLRDEVDKLFSCYGGDCSSPSVAQKSGQYRPALNVWEETDGYVVEAECPGFSIEDIDISVADKELTIKGEHRKDEEYDKKNFHRRERLVSSFSRSVSFPIDIDSEKAEAQMKHGVLTIRLPKSAAVQPKKIAVRH